MNLIEKVDLRRAFYLQQLINEHREECMNEWYDKCKFKKEKETEMKKVERYINEIIKGKGEYSTTYHKNVTKILLNVFQKIKIIGMVLPLIIFSVILKQNYWKI